MLGSVPRMPRNTAKLIVEFPPHGIPSRPAQTLPVKLLAYDE